MAKRKLINTLDIQLACKEVETEYDKGWMDCVGHCLEQIQKANPITEQEIVKPYLEKLKAKFEEYRDKWNRYSNEYESGRYESYDICIDDIEDMINLLKGEEE